ncbi:MAG: ABC transporter permease [Tenericutes bacterium GWC2_39_45]|jgi:ABC-type sugar transport system permease subunit|nr:MAG: ABC transporter permease [Tenericutes bacterium GWA2_38_26]OHE30719.1 MAG: ABC transporter permease [Tenericutes bacterium GWC2_39_45]OHE31519.1 MAG: ABC transporter permease [Tenericutes bacterium GWD2_38_27]OHE36642.1 MAG: ABC transporter permease [Tenericutes bacterium GWE2_38_8]OHE41959.1 MAG: ABC transporter permease [Tenericutes bacterium GWF2_38_8]HBG33336.1 sugar ABC transporter permease [Acholeplasmataceae bacterium]
MAKRKISRGLRENLIGYSFIGIWVFGFFVFMFYPFITSMIYSMSEVRILGGGIEIEFQWFENYKNIFQMEEGFAFIEALIDFLKEIVFQVPIIIVFSVMIAVLLNQPIKGRGAFRSIFFLPVIISSGPVINELITQGAGGANIFESYGFISIIENTLNPALSGPIINVFSEIIIIFWFSGVQILIFLAGLQKVDRQIYEAARVDGAGPWESFWKITLPSLSSLIFVNVIYTVVLLSTFSENAVIVSIKSNMFNINTGYGMASAMAWVYFIIVMLLIAIVAIVFIPKNQVVRRKAR